MAKKASLRSMRDAFPHSDPAAGAAAGIDDRGDLRGLKCSRQGPKPEAKPAIAPRAGAGWVGSGKPSVMGHWIQRTERFCGLPLINLPH